MNKIHILAALVAMLVACDAPPTKTAPLRSGALTAAPSAPSGWAPGSAPSASSRPAGAPQYARGRGTLRLGLYAPKIAADAHRAKLPKLAVHGWPAVQTWAITGGDNQLRARLQIADVDPARGKALCAWLESISWADPGECAMREGSSP